MKNFNRLFAAIIFVIILMLSFFNICLMNIDSYNGRQYRVEANRVADTISSKGLGGIDLSDYSTITAAISMNENNEKGFFEAESDYLIREIDGAIYRIEYDSNNNENTNTIIRLANFFLIITSLIAVGLILYIRQRILKPFVKFREAPYELSRGNLTVPIMENKDRFFGRFAWGVDLLRENLEQSKQRELVLQKEKKTLLLSLSHDIKTPLSAIKLYSKALSKELYADKKKQIEIAESINKKADEIEEFVSEIIKASNEDFLHLEVNAGEFYLSQVIDKIDEYYRDKLSLIDIDFTIGKYSNCILKGDPDRFIEVLQNIMENSVKYGDGRNISIEFSVEEDYQLITVKNSGCTLSDTELPHIFDSFWRGSNVGSNQGSGLGLYICRQLMHKMDGEIFAEIKENNMYVTSVLNKC